MGNKKEIHQSYEFTDFTEAKSFVDKVAELAEKADHHPKIQLDYNTVDLWFTTHSAGSVTEKDEQLAAAVEALIQDRLPVVEGLPKEVKFYGDGGSRGNPGPAAAGYVLMDMADTVLETGGEFMGDTTNNQAEYHSLEMGLERALAAGVETIHVFMDSQLAIRQLEGAYKVKSPDLLPRYQHVKDMLGQFKKFTLMHVPREYNKLADAEVNRILDSV